MNDIDTGNESITIKLGFLVPARLPRPNSIACGTDVLGEENRIGGEARDMRVTGKGVEKNFCVSPVAPFGAPR